MVRSTTSITGAVVSATVTMRDAMPVLPEGSLAAYVMSVLPGMFTSTAPVVTTAQRLAQLSVAVAPGSMNAVAHSTAGFAPTTLTTGAIVSVTCTVRVTGVAWPPAWSTAS